MSRSASRRRPDNPFAHFAKLNAETDVRRERRALSADELARLISAAERSGATFRGLTGADRAILYRMATFTGLRANELASLMEGSLDFDADSPTVTVEAGYSKRRRKDVMPLHPDLAVRLQEWLSERREREDGPAVIPMAGKPSDAPLWPGTWSERSARMLRKDLKAARDAWLREVPEGTPERDRREQSDFLCPVDDDGKVFDFHGTRHQFISTLAQNGVHPKVAKELARHSTITLTMDRYAHVGLIDLTAALDKLPSLPSTEAAEATGTDDRPVQTVPKMVAGMVAGPAAKTCVSVREIETPKAAEAEADEDAETARLMRDASDCDHMKENTPGRIRTCDLRIRSPLLYPTELRALGIHRAVLINFMRLTDFEPRTKPLKTAKTSRREPSATGFVRRSQGLAL